MSSQWENQLNALRSEIENKTKQISLLEQLIALEAKHAGVSVVNVEIEEGEFPANDGKQQSKPKRKARAGNSQERKDSDKGMSLPDLLRTIGQQYAGQKIQYKALAEEVMKTGYNSNSKNFNNMVYQSLQKLVKRGVYTKDVETREYQFIGG